MLSGESRYTDVPPFRIHSEHYGAGADVVLLHGLSASRRWWRFTTPALVGQYRVHVPELVGFGRSRTWQRLPPLSELAQVFQAWLSRNGIEAAHLVGHSMGGQLAVHMAAEQAVPCSLTLVDASGLPRVWSVAEGVRFLAGVLPPRRWGAPQFAPTMALDALRSGPRSLWQAAHHVLSDDVRPLLQALRCPTLVVWGALDPLVPLEHGRELAASIPGARLVVLADAAHNAMADRPAEFNRVLLDFLSGVPCG